MKSSVWRAILLLTLLIVAVASSEPASLGARQTPPSADEGFVPIDELPPDERLPAAPFLIAAYSLAWIVVVVYLWSIWRRLGRVEREIAEVSRRVRPGHLPESERADVGEPASPTPRGGEVR